ncbi:MAG: hypothetical protein ABSG78_01430 [Verrucomicrobiota bacterium]|jgi:uncharacterized protein (TIGR03067 family)
MKKPTDITFGLALVFLAALLGAPGCSKTPKPDKPDSVVLQGTWKGQEANATGSDSLVFSGTNLEFHGSNPQEWYKATFTLLEDKNPKQMIAIITDCPEPKYVGKTAYAIYQIQDGTFTIAAHEPGDTNVPTTFDDPQVRKVAFKQ